MHHRRASVDDARIFSLDCRLVPFESIRDDGIERILPCRFALVDQFGLPVSSADGTLTINASQISWHTHDNEVRGSGLTPMQMERRETSPRQYTLG